jgi:hypothetical protein
MSFITMAEAVRKKETKKPKSIWNAPGIPPDMATSPTITASPIITAFTGRIIFT